jgi:hypothetical protein
MRDSLKNLYVLGFQSANTTRDGKWRKLAVKVTPQQACPKSKWKQSPGTSFRRDSEDGDSEYVSGPKSQISGFHSRILRPALAQGSLKAAQGGLPSVQALSTVIDSTLLTE